MKQLNWFLAIGALILAGCSTGNSNSEKVVQEKGIPVKVSEIVKVLITPIICILEPLKNLFCSS